MRIEPLLHGERAVFSFEFFPPKTPGGLRALLRVLEELRPLEPSYVSVTYGAMGSNRGEMIDLVVRIRNEIGLNPMAHLTCVGHTSDELAAILDRFAGEGVDNILALRGDAPPGEEFRPVPGGFRYASEFVAFVRSRWKFCLGGAAYPEGHPEAAGAAADLDNLVTKVRAGVDFLVTQLFFSNADYFAFLHRAREAGISVPIVPGIMPITDVAQLHRFVHRIGARVPAELEARLQAAAGDDEAVLSIGVEHAIAQCRELLDRGAPGVHFYTLNKSPATRRILGALRAEGR